MGYFPVLPFLISEDSMLFMTFGRKALKASFSEFFQQLLLIFIEFFRNLNADPDEQVAAWSFRA